MISRIFQVYATNTGRRDQGVGIQLLEEPRRLYLPKVILYDMVSNTLPNGIIINDVLLREGFARKDLKVKLMHNIIKCSESATILTMKVTEMK